MAQRLLVDSVPISYQIVESGENDGKMVVRGEYAFCGRPTANKRVYTEELMNKQLSRLESSLSERKVFGELDHPEDGRTKLARTSHIVTNLSIDEQGRVIGESEILPTQRGKDLMALLKSGAKVGVSSRGFGSTVTNEKGEEVVQEDYKLVTFDFVADPANHTSYPDVHYEDKEDPEMTTKPKEDTKSTPKESTREEFAEQAREIFAEEREKIREEVRAELLSDSDLGEDKKIVEGLMSLLKDRLLDENAQEVVSAKDDEIRELKASVAEAELKIQGLEEQNEQLAAVAQEIGYKYFLEQVLAGDEDADVIRSLVGDVTEYESHEDIEAAVEAARDHLNQHAEKLAQEESRRQRELGLIEAEKSKMAERVDRLTEALEKSTQLNEALALQVYTERRLVNHPKAEEIRSLIESSKPETKAGVDEIIENVTVGPQRDPVELDQVRARIRTITGGGVTPTSHDEESGDTDGATPVSEATNYNNLGVPLTELKRMAGC